MACAAQGSKATRPSVAARAGRVAPDEKWTTLGEDALLRKNLGERACTEA